MSKMHPLMLAVRAQHQMPPTGVYDSAIVPGTLQDASAAVAKEVEDSFDQGHLADVGDWLGAINQWLLSGFSLPGLATAPRRDKMARLRAQSLASSELPQRRRI